MSLGSFLKSALHIGKEVVDVVAPFSALLPPPAGTILNAILMIEQMIPQSGQGQLKKELVTKLGASLFPHIPADKLSKSIDAIVTVLNDLNSQPVTSGSNNPALPALQKQ